MPIRSQCRCGKSYSVDDSFAGKRFKCKVCGSVGTVPAAVADEAEFEFVDDPLPPVAVKKAVKAVEVIEDDVGEEPEPRPEPRRKKKRKKKQSEGMTREEERDLIDKLNATDERRKRTLRGVAFLVLGIVVLIGAGIMFALRAEFVFHDDPSFNRNYLGGIVLVSITGLAGVVKGAFSLLTGQMLDEED